MSKSVVWCNLDRDVIVVDGNDAGQFLHSQLANDITSMPVGATVHSLLLEPTGHVVSLLRVIRTGVTTFVIDVERGDSDVVVTRLSKFVLRAKVNFTIVDACVRAYRGTDITAHVQQLVAGTNFVLASPWWEDPHACDVIAIDGQAEIAQLPEIGVNASEQSIDAFRVDAGWPRMNRDIERGDIPATTGILRVSASFTKGCYPGQELVERMDSRGTMAPTVLRIFPKDAAVETEMTATSVGNQFVLARVPRQQLSGDELSSVWNS